MSVEQFAETIKTDSRLTVGQKNQCFLFLRNYDKAGIEICKRYISICTGETVVFSDRKNGQACEIIMNLLLASPGLTSKEIAEQIGINENTVSDRLCKAYQRGLLVREGTRRKGYKYAIKPTRSLVEIGA